MSRPLHIGRIESIRLRAEVDGLPESSLGAMAARNGLLVRVEDGDGAFGWGEIWCNFPPHASQSRQQLLETVIAPELTGTRFESHEQVRPHLEERWSIMATHVGEPGPFGHCIAGLDMAVWDLAARRAGQPLAAFLAAQSADSVMVYASTPSPPARAPELSRALVESGHRAIKLKVGIDPRRDEDQVRGVREAIGDDVSIMIDANQRWSVNEAAESINRLADYGLTFAEEPIAAQQPMQDWRHLSSLSNVPLAAGENICSDADYAAHLGARALSYYQPDVAKWGGVGGCYSVGREIVEAGSTFCPHYMGTAVGLAASLHLLAAVGGGGFVELDSNQNPLRTALCDLDLNVTEGRVRVPIGDGIGVIPEPDVLRQYRVS